MPTHVASHDGTLVSPKAPVSLDKTGLPSCGDVVLAKLRIERVIGEGGMAVVYAARHELLDLPVALKILSPEIVNDEVLARFFHEAKVATRIRNVHVCSVLDAGLLDDGAPYMTMELLEGLNLAELLEKRGPLPADIAVDLVLQALEGLAHAHAVGVIHRDLKPTNLFLAYSARRAPTLKVIDFGISKSGMLEGLSRVGTVIGSPTYMAPEQIDEPGSIDARSDLWGIGVVLYELLTGKMPFDGETIEELVARIRYEPPTPLRVHRPDLPAGLELVIQKCLSKNKEERYADALALATVLAPFASSAPFERLARMRVAKNEGSTSEPPPRESGMRARTVAGQAPPPPPVEISGGSSLPPASEKTRRLMPPAPSSHRVHSPPIVMERSSHPSMPPPSRSSSSNASLLPLAAAAIIVCAVSMVAGAGLATLRHSKVDARSVTAPKVDCAKAH